MAFPLGRSPRLAPVPLTLVLLAAAAVVPSVHASADVSEIQMRALAPRSTPAGATMFTPVSAEAAGVVMRNNYADPEMWGERHQEFTLGSMGTGVAIADYDNDGRPDIFVVSKTESSRLFRNLGDWRFEDVTGAAGLARPAAEDTAAWKQGAAFADVDNDGWLDLHLCRFGAPNLLFMNQRDGTFREEAAERGLAVVDASGMAAFCDYDHDGWLDVFIQTNMLDAAARPHGQRDYLFRNDGDGTFTDVTARAGIAGETLAHSATWWDYDGDDWPDLYVAVDFARPDSLYRNNRDGTFTECIESVVPHMPYSSMGTDLGDVDGDGRIDLLVADMAATTREKDQRGMAVSRASTPDAFDALAAPQYPRSALFLATGVGRCLEAACLAGVAATDWTWSVRFEDLDNDGRLDLHVTNGMNREYQNTDLRDRMILSENPAARTRIIRDSPELIERNLAYRNLGDLQFQDTGAAWGLDQAGISFGAAFGDLDGDGDLDLVYSNYQAGVTLLRNDAAGRRLVIALRGTTSNRSGAGATVRVRTPAGEQVRTLTLARGYLSSSEPVVHFGLGEASEVAELSVAWPSGHRRVFTAIPADRHLTLTEPAGPAVPPPAPPPAATLYSEVGDTLGLAVTARDPWSSEAAPQPLAPFRPGHRGPALAAADLDGDGREEILVGGTIQDTARALRRAGGAAAFQSTALPTTGAAAKPVAPDGPLLAFDADADGDADLLVTRSGGNLSAASPELRPRLLLNDGAGTFAPAAEPLATTPVSAGATAAADFDRDGRLDLFIGGRIVPRKYPTAPRSVLLANRGGRFEDVTPTLAPGLEKPGMVTAALWSDIDDDGWSDLVVALEWGGILYWHNDEGRGFSDRSAEAGFTSAGRGWWTALAAADVNHDGRIDIVAGNVGLNTLYRATPTEPALLYHGPLGDNTTPLIIEAHHDQGRVYPWRTRAHLAAVIPSLRRRFPTNDGYAAATLAEVFPAEKLASAQVYSATEFRSGVLLSRAGGGHEFRALPRIAQVAPVQGVVATDLDGDGRDDIAVVHNSFAPIPSTGRFDGGLGQLLRGDGRGGFTAVAPGASGLVVPGDAKALVVLDLDDDAWPDLLASRNNAPLLAFRHTGATDRTPLRVRLRGPAGNRDAVGARVTLALADGSRLVREVRAGGGYFSQDSAALFFGYTAANPARTVEIRWPDGGASSHPVPAGSRRLDLAR